MTAIGVVIGVVGLIFILAAPQDHSEGQTARGRSSAILGALLVIGGFMLATHGSVEPVKETSPQEIDR